MGSMITLCAGEVDLDWGKNDGFISHLDLYQFGDEALGPYHYVKEDDSPIVEMKRCLCRAAARVKPRLEMLGYSEAHFPELLARWLGDDVEHAPVDVEAFRAALRAIPWRDVAGRDIEFGDAIREQYVAALLERGHSVDVAPSMLAWGNWLDPYMVLAMLGAEDEFQDLPVRWNFADVLDNGWADEAQFKPDGTASTWLVVTEGSTDALILQRALALLLPDVADFFDFIDMKEGNPFPGVGSIVAFCKGLQRINYGGRMLVVLDNDTAGRGALKDLLSLGLSPNIKVTCLPDLQELRSFPTIGPTGDALADINGRAAAIECFLDFNAVARPPRVRWTSFDKRMGHYQGELVAKDEYSAAFRRGFPNPGYNVSKLRALCEHLVAVCTEKA